MSNDRRDVVGPFRREGEPNLGDFPPPPPLVFRVKTMQMLGTGIFGAVGAGLCWYFRDEYSRNAQFLFAFTAVAVVGFRYALRRGATVVLDAHGVRDFRQGVGLVPWSEIASVRFVAGFAHFLVCDLRDPERRSELRSRGISVWLQRMFAGRGDVVVRMSELTPSIDAAIAYIRALPGGDALTGLRPPSWKRP